MLIGARFLDARLEGVVRGWIGQQVGAGALPPRCAGDSSGTASAPGRTASASAASTSGGCLTEEEEEQLVTAAAEDYFAPALGLTNVFPAALRPGATPLATPLSVYARLLSPHDWRMLDLAAAARLDDLVAELLLLQVQQGRVGDGSESSARDGAAAGAGADADGHRSVAGTPKGGRVWSAGAGATSSCAAAAV
jgi:hypothetical protein